MSHRRGMCLPHLRVVCPGMRSSGQGRPSWQFPVEGQVVASRAAGDLARPRHLREHSPSRRSRLVARQASYRAIQGDRGERAEGSAGHPAIRQAGMDAPGPSRFCLSGATAGRAGIRSRGLAAVRKPPPHSRIIKSSSSYPEPHQHGGTRRRSRAARSAEGLKSERRPHTFREW